MKETNNKVTIAGEIVSEYAYSHEAAGEKFYTTVIKSVRLSGTSDLIPVTISERLISPTMNDTGVFVEINGEFRSYNDKENRKLKLSVFAYDISFLEDVRNVNDIGLIGYICKEPLYRTTPLGREITDVMLAVNRAYGKSDYIPCVVWGRNARFVENLAVGTKLKVNGRIQSREYNKKISENEFETRTAFEMSVSRLGVLEDAGENNNAD
jgi:single-stranded DNA-binding protein